MVQSSSARLGPTLPYRVDISRGLSAREVERLLATYGPNRLVPEARARVWQRYLQPFLSPMALLLLGAGAVYLFLGELIDAAIVLGAVIPIVLVDYIMESRAERTLEKLRGLAARRVLVLRDGRWQEIPSDRLVPGDICDLREGDIVPADMVLLSGSDIQVDESALTGESQPVSKTPSAGGFSPGVIGERADQLLAGTTMLSGHGIGQVIATGRHTEYGALGSLVAEITPQPTPLQRSIRKLVWTFAVVAAIFCFGVVILTLWQGASWPNSLIAGVSLGIAAVPEEFPMVFTLFLTIGAWRMARRNALIRRLAGVETLGSTTVICTDKTGTLTEGRMRVGALAVDGNTIPAEDVSLSEPEMALLTAAVLASEPEPFDPIEFSIMEFSQCKCLDPGGIFAAHTLVHEYPFDQELKRMSHVWRSSRGELRLYVKGAMEGILSHCLISEERKSQAELANLTMARQGMRVIAVATKRLRQVSGNRKQDEANLHFRGLIGFVDPPRPEARQAVEECQRAGIRVIMITGDHPVTAHAVAEAVGLYHDNDSVVLGEQLEAASDEEFRSLIANESIFARITPSQKYRLVTGLQQAGQVVAMTGDGINDAPALKKADVGVAMGRRGTEVAREAATMVLLDDNFATIVEAVKEGRRVFDSIRRSSRYLVAFHTPILLSALIVPLLGWSLLLLPVYLVWLELIVHPTVSLVFGGEFPDPRVMNRPPRSLKEPILSGSTILWMVIVGFVVFVGVVALYGWGLAQGFDIGRARALALADLILAGTVLVLGERCPTEPIWKCSLSSNRFLLPIIAGTLASLVFVLYVPAISSLVSLAPPHARDWLTILPVALSTTLWVEVVKAWRNWKQKHSGTS